MFDEFLIAVVQDFYYNKISRKNEAWKPFPSRDDKGLTNPKEFEGPVLNSRAVPTRGGYLNELVIGETRNNASAIFQMFFFSCCKIEFVQLW